MLRTAGTERQNIGLPDWETIILNLLCVLSLEPWHRFRHFIILTLPQHMQIFIVIHY